MGNGKNQIQDLKKRVEQTIQGKDIKEKPVIDSKTMLDEIDNVGKKTTGVKK